MAKKPKLQLVVRKSQGQARLVMDPPKDIEADKVIAAIREAVEDHWLEQENPEQQKYRNAAASLRVSTVVETEATTRIITVPAPQTQEADELLDAVASALFSTHPLAKQMSWQRARLDLRLKTSLACMAKAVLDSLVAWADGQRPSSLVEG